MGTAAIPAGVLIGQRAIVRPANALAVDARGQRLVELRLDPEPGKLRLFDPPCPLALAVITHRHQVLLGLNRWREEWELPGGIIDGDETARVAASREILEETGLAVDHSS